MGCGAQLVEFKLDAGEADEAGEAPTVISTFPMDAARSVSLESSISATFSQAMDGASLTVKTFTVFQGSTPVLGVVTLDDVTDTATFNPVAELRLDRLYTATITTEVRDTENMAMVADYTWSFNMTNLDVIEASATAWSVDAPDYTLDPAGLTVLTDVDGVVQSAMGSAALGAGLVTGQRYVVVDAAGLDTYVELDDAFVSATDVAITPSIPAAAFTLVESDLSLSQVRTLIVANISNDVRSYQAFEVTFHAAL
jgi:hypothetical protein